MSIPTIFVNSCILDEIKHFNVCTCKPKPLQNRNVLQVFWLETSTMLGILKKNVVNEFLFLFCSCVQLSLQSLNHSVLIREFSFLPSFCCLPHGREEWVRDWVGVWLLARVNTTQQPESHWKCAHLTVICIPDFCINNFQLSLLNSIAERGFSWQNQNSVPCFLVVPGDAACREATSKEYGHT